eukprot:SAG31_NODE_18372_length_638_cov_1.914657_1_plen_69_part_00
MYGRNLSDVRADPAAIRGSDLAWPWLQTVRAGMLPRMHGDARDASDRPAGGAENVNPSHHAVMTVRAY